MWWGFALSAMGVTGYFLVTFGKPRLGHTVYLIDQILWVAFTIHVRQPGLLIGCAVYAVIAIAGLRQSKEER